MGFFKSIGNIASKAVQAVALPVTIPAKVAEKANIPIVSQAARGFQDIYRAPGELVSGGSGMRTFFSGISNILPAANLVAPAAGLPPGILNAIGPYSSDLSAKPVESTTNPYVYVSGTPTTGAAFPPPEDNSKLLIIAGISGLALLFLLRRK